jgi:putative membrane protein insertion efficiency factor
MTARLAVLFIRLYQAVLSPIVGGACRFEPSCSAYAIEAFETHGARRGLVLTLRRLGRCHPFGGHGYDPVPAAEVGHSHFRGTALERKCEGPTSATECRL